MSPPTGFTLPGSTSSPPHIDRTLIPRRVLLAPAGSRTEPVISPDGRWIAFLQDEGGEPALMIAPASAPSKAKRASGAGPVAERSVRWSAARDVVLFLRRGHNEGEAHLWAASAGTGAARDLSPYDGVRAELVGVSGAQPSAALVTMNDRDAGAPDLYVVDVTTGTRRLAVKNDVGWSSGLVAPAFVADGQLRLTLGCRSQPDRSAVCFRLSSGGLRAPALEVAAQDTLSTRVVGVDASGRMLYLIDGRGRDTAALVAIDLATGASTVLAQDARADVEDVAVDPSTGRPLFALAEYDRARQIVVDPSWQKDEDYFSGLSPDSTHRLLGCTGDTTRCLWSLTTSDEPTRFYVYDRPRREADLLFVEQPSLLGLRLARMVPHEVLARDGLPLVAYVWLPPSTDPRGTGKPDHPLPTVVHPHDGGPWSRDSWGYSPVDQWLVSRGYAVVSVNYRGSFGFGRRFREAGDREWGGKMHDDVMDVLGWAELTHIADPQRVAMFGDSYGGYESLWALAMAPGTFRCAVDAFGVTDLPSMVAQAPPAILPPDEIARRVGEWWTPFGRAMLDARSPLSHAASIRQPVLIAHGARDVLVRLDQSERMVQALGLHQPDVTYMTFSDEGHIFHRPANRLAFGAAAETFLSQCLGGKAEPIGDAMRGDSVSVPVGADRIFGLVDALPRR